MSLFPFFSGTNLKSSDTVRGVTCAALILILWDKSFSILTFLKQKNCLSLKYIVSPLLKIFPGSCLQFFFSSLFCLAQILPETTKIFFSIDWKHFVSVGLGDRCWFSYWSYYQSNKIIVCIRPLSIRSYIKRSLILEKTRFV